MSRIKFEETMNLFFQKLKLYFEEVTEPNRENLNEFISNYLETIKPIIDDDASIGILITPQVSKYQYNKSDVVAHNGFKYRQYLTDIGVDTDMILQEIIQWVQETGCSEYGDLVNYSVSEKFDDWFPTVRSQTIFLTAYLRSNRHKPRVFDKETGELK